MKKAVVLLGVLLIVVGAGAWLAFRTPEPASSAPSIVGEDQPTNAENLTSSLGVQADQEQGRQALTGDGTTGLSVTVRWEDSSPASGVALRCMPTSLDGPLWERRGKTDASGSLEFAPLLPGTWVVFVDRTTDRIEVDLPEGRREQLEIEIPVGVAVRGRVIDELTRPVPDAAILIGRNPKDGALAARTAADGTFSIRSAEPGVLIAARAPGFEPSDPEPIESDSEIVLELRPAPGSLQGTVRAVQGSPIEEATIHLRWAGPTSGLPYWRWRLLRTDGEGRFVEHGMSPGAWRVYVGAPGYASWYGAVDLVPGVPARLDVDLSVGATIRGQVTTPTGAVVEGAVLRAMSGIFVPEPGVAYEGPLWAVPETASDVDGRYALAHVMPGRTKVLVETQVRDGGVSMELELVDGQEQEWNPVLGSGLPIHGVVVDPDGKPLEGWTLHVWPAPLIPLPDVRADGEGRFRWEDVEDGSYDILVVADRSVSDMHRETVSVSNVRPSVDPLHIEVPWTRIPSARIVGRVLDPDGSPLTSLSTSFHRVAESGRFEVAGGRSETSDGRFESKLLIPGGYRVRVNTEHGSLFLGEWDVGRGEVVDVGLHRYAVPGLLELRVVAFDGSLVRNARLAVRSEKPIRSLSNVSVPEEGTTVSLQPGRYVVSTWGSALAMASSGPIEVLPGRTTTQTIRVPNGVECIVRFPPNPVENYTLYATWRDDRGEMVYQTASSFGESDEPIDLRIKIPPGRYTIEVEDIHGRTVTTATEVLLDTPRVIELRVPAR